MFPREHVMAASRACYTLGQARSKLIRRVCHREHVRVPSSNEGGDGMGSFMVRDLRARQVEGPAKSSEKPLSVTVALSLLLSIVLAFTLGTSVSLGSPAAPAPGRPGSVIPSASFADTLNIYRFNGSRFVQVPGSLTQIAVGADGRGVGSAVLVPDSAVWGINEHKGIFRFNPSNRLFEKMPGTLEQIAVGSSFHIWGVNVRQEIYRFDGSQFVQIPGSLRQIAVGADGAVWGLNAADEIYNWSPTTRQFEQIPGKLQTIAVGSRDVVWGLSRGNYTGDGSLFQTHKIWQLNSTTQLFEQRLPTPGWGIPAESLSVIAVGPDGVVFGIRPGQEILTFDPARVKPPTPGLPYSGESGWADVPGLLETISVGSRAHVWGINANKQIYKFNLSTRRFDNIPGRLTQIAVGASGATWGISRVVPAPPK